MYIGKQPTPVPLSTSDLNDDIITQAKMADDAIALAELKAGTDGEIISWDASGNPVAIGAGTSGHFLKSAGAGAQPVFAAAGGGKVLQVVSTNKVDTFSEATDGGDVGSLVTGLTVIPQGVSEIDTSSTIVFVLPSITESEFE